MANDYREATARFPVTLEAVADSISISLACICVLDGHSELSEKKKKRAGRRDYTGLACNYNAACRHVK